MHQIVLALAAIALTAIAYALWNTPGFIEERERAKLEDRQRKAVLSAMRTRCMEVAEAGRPQESGRPARADVRAADA